MAQVRFSAQVDAWVAATKERTTAVFRESVQRTIIRMQTPVAKGGNLPVDTGYLRASLLGSTSLMPSMRENATQEADAIVLTIAGLDLGQTFYAGYTANYARHQEYGTSGRPGRRFVGLAADRWQTTVSEVVRDLRSRANAG